MGTERMIRDERPEREGCCATWPKPCSYHEGWADAVDTLTERSASATTSGVPSPALAPTDQSRP